MLRICLNISWKQKLTNEELYGDLPPVTAKVAERRMKLAGHCIRHPDVTASTLVLWQPTKGKVSRGRPPVNYIDNLKDDAGVEEVGELRTVMQDRLLWRERSRLVRAGARPK